MDNLNRRKSLTIDLIRFIDILIITLSAGLASFIRFEQLTYASSSAPIIFITLVVYLLQMQAMKGYQNFSPRNKILGLTKVNTSLLVTFSVILVIAYFSKSSTEISRLWIFYWFMLSIIMVAVGRLLLALWLENKNSGHLLINNFVLLVGDDEYARKALLHLTEQSEKESFLLRKVFRLESDKTRRNSAEEAISSAVVYCREVNIDYIVIAISKENYKKLKVDFSPLQELSATILEAPTEGFTSLLVTEENNDWVLLEGMPFNRIAADPFSKWGWWLKNCEDYLLGSCALILFSPLMILIALAIKLTSSGPVLFAQRRHGFNGREFVVYKFRTMITQRHETQNIQQATRNDPRVTKIGRLLRRISLDELPQLFNVVRGDMSLVGPRPHAVEHNRIYSQRIIKYVARHRVKPGITGWAQVNGFRGETKTDDDMEKRIGHDLYYINNWSLLFDLRILLLTIFVGFLNKNAY